MNLEKDKISKLLLSFSIPAMTGMIVSSLYNVVDRIFIGQGVGADAFSSLTVTMPLAIIIMAFSMLFGLGSAACISISLGQKNKEQAEHLLGNGIVMLFVASIIITIVGLTFLDEILLLFGADKDTLFYAHEYSQIILYGTVFNMVGFGLNHMLRASGKPKLAMATMLIGAILNTILDPLFIFVFHMGISGAAIATIISQFVSMVWVIASFFRKDSTIRFRKANLIPRLHIISRTCSVGVSSFATQVAASVVNIIANSALLNYGGKSALGAMGVVGSVAMIFMMPVFGLNQGSQPIIGFNYGAKQYHRVKQTLRYTITVAVIICSIGWLIGMLFPVPIIHMFTRDQDIVNAATLALRINLSIFPLIGIQVICTVFYQAIGSAVKALILSMLRQVIILIPMYLILPKFFGITGVWMSMPVSDGISFVIVMSFFIYNMRKLTEMEKAHESELEQLT